MSSSSSPERLHALDAVRGFALLAGVAFHACLSFLPGPQIWMVMDDQRSTALSVLFFTLHMFRMAVFFLIAGFMAHMSLHRLGLGGFIRDRARRIALPLVVGWPILFAAILAATIWAAVKAGGAAATQGPPPAFPTLPAFPLTHLWFLYVLLLFYLAALLLRGLVVLVDRKGGLRAGLDGVVAWIVGLWAPVLLAAPLALALGLSSPWLMWFGITTPDSSLIPNTPALVGYGTAFGLGWMLHRQVGLLEIWKRRWPFNLTLAVICTVACLAMTGLAPVLKPAASGTLTWAYASVYALGVFAWTLGLIGLALRFCSNHSPVRRYIADASYWIYLVHLPIVIVLQTAVADQPWPWPVKYAAILAAAFAILFASYQLLVRHSFIGATLNGRRPRRLAKSAALVQPGDPGDVP
jgi:glucan biosynthesis protein C